MICDIAFFALITLAIAKYSSQQYNVQNLLNLPSDYSPEMHAGIVEVERDKNIFFWHIKSDEKDGEKSTIIWLNGGPGCSSMEGAFAEIGPFEILDSLQLKKSKNRWNKISNVLIVDQPVGTGFSFGKKYETSMKQITDTFISFLRNWLEIFPEYKDNKLYIAGESFAGTYIPYFATELLARDENPKLAGIIIGNGWMDAKTQYKALATFAEQNLLLADAKENLKKQYEASKEQCFNELVSYKKFIHLSSCETMFIKMLEATRKTDENGDTCINYFDQRLRDSFPACGLNWPNNLGKVNEYINNPKVLKALNVNLDATPIWTECSVSVNKKLKLNNTVEPFKLLEKILKKIRVLLYAGDQDIICNYLGIEEMLTKMKWQGQRGALETSDWILNEKVGISKSRGNLQYYRIYGASHMVPIDKPMQLFEMIKMLVKDNLTEIIKYDHSLRIWILRLSLIIFFDALIIFSFVIFLYMMKRFSKARYNKLGEDLDVPA